MNWLCKAILPVILAFHATDMHAQKVFLVEQPSMADVRVHVVNNISRADLKVYRVGMSYEAGRNNGRWFTALHPSLADVKVCFVDNEIQADVLIAYVHRAQMAGWVNEEKMSHFERKR